MEDNLDELDFDRLVARRASRPEMIRIAIDEGDESTAVHLSRDLSLVEAEIERRLASPHR